MVGRLFFYSAEISFSLRRYKPFLFKSYNTVSQHFKKILEKVTQEPNVVKALTKTSVSMELDDVDDMFQQFGDAMQVLIKLIVSIFLFLLDPMFISRVSSIRNEPTVLGSTSSLTKR